MMTFFLHRVIISINYSPTCMLLVQRHSFDIRSMNDTTAELKKKNIQGHFLSCVIEYLLLTSTEHQVRKHTRRALRQQYMLPSGGITNELHDSRLIHRHSLLKSNYHE